MSVLVYIEQSNKGPVSSSWEVMGKAKQIAGELNMPLAAVVMGGDVAAGAEAARSYGAATVYTIASPLLANFRLSAYAAGLKQAIAASGATVVLASATMRGRELSAFVACELGAGLAPDAVDLRVDGGKIVAVRSIYSNNTTGEYTGIPNPKAAAALLKEAGYAGTPVVLLRPTDIPLNAKMPLVAKQQLEAAGFVVDVQQMDWATLLARRGKKDPVASGGWNAFMPVFGGSDVGNPLTMPMMNTAGNDGWFGWQDDPTIQELKAKFILAGTGDEKKQIAQQLQARAFETVSHVPLGQYIIPAAVRLNVSGLLSAPANVYWNVEKK